MYIYIYIYIYQTAIIISMINTIVTHEVVTLFWSKPAQQPKVNIQPN